MTPYIIKIILCSALFFVVYKFLLEKEKMHHFNRFYLLGSLIASLIIPLITFNSQMPVQTVAYYEIISNTISQSTSSSKIDPLENNINYDFLILCGGYFIITIILLFRFIRNLSKILSRANKNETIPYKNAKIVLIEEDHTPHSFLNYLFINRWEYEKIENEILIHEYTHIQQKHSCDILLTEFLQIFIWFNPFLYLYRKAIQLNHEFIADEAVINSSSNIQRYQHLLIDKTNLKKTYNLTSQFNYLVTKKRLLMMSKTKSFQSSLIRQIAVLPILVLSIFLFSSKTTAQDSLNVANPPQKLISEGEKEIVTTEEKAEPKEGVSDELLAEYEQIVNKYRNEKSPPKFKKFSDDDFNRLQTIYLAMNKEQRSGLEIIFISIGPPMGKEVPTPEQIETWKDAKIYGLWIDNKRVSNSELGKYKNTDFAHTSVSKLYKNAKNYGKHYYQVDLMTISHYEEYYKNALEQKDKYHMAVRTKGK